MSDENRLEKATPARRGGEVLWEWVRDRDQRSFRCETRYNEEVDRWETLLYEGGTLFATHGGFATRSAALHWGSELKKVIERIV